MADGLRAGRARHGWRIANHPRVFRPTSAVRVAQRFLHGCIASKGIGLVRAVLSAEREQWEAAQHILAEHLTRHPDHGQAAELLYHVEAEWLLEQARNALGARRTAVLRVE